jgi:phage terminase Nu1 subunit (DNA packaging protein)
VRTVLKLAEKGIVVRLARGRFAQEQSVANIIEHYRNRASGREAQDGTVDIVKANAALRDSQRRLNEIKIAQLEGNLISMPEVQAAWDDIALGVKQLFLAFPSRARFDLPHMSGADQKVLDRLARDMPRPAALALGQNS